MKPETILGVQKATGWVTAYSGLTLWITQNATFITAVMTMITGVIFAICAIWNARSNRISARANELRASLNKRDMRSEILEEIKCDETLKTKTENSKDIEDVKK